MDLRRRIPIALLLAALGAAAAASPACTARAEEPAPSAEDSKEKSFRFHLARARGLAADAARTGDGSAASESVDAYLAASRFRPKDPVPLAEAALLALDFGDGATTARLLAAIHEIAPGSGAFRFVKGALNISRGEWRDAMAEFEAAKGMDFKTEQAADRHYEAMVGYGFELVDFNRYDEAVEVLDRVIAMRPTHNMVPRAFYHIALAHRRLQQTGEAEKALRLCMERFPSFAVAYGELADLLTELSRFDEALAILDRAVRMDPSYAQGYLLRAVAYTGKQMWKEADAAFAEFEKRFPPTGNSELQRGIFYQASGQPEKGIERLRKCLALDPTQIRGHLLLSMCFHDLGMDEEAAAAKARWKAADEELKSRSHEKRQEAKRRFGPEKGAEGAGGEGEGAEEDGAPPAGDGGHGEGAR